MSKWPVSSFLIPSGLPSPALHALPLLVRSWILNSQPLSTLIITRLGPLTGDRVTFYPRLPCRDSSDLLSSCTMLADNLKGLMGHPQSFRLCAVIYALSTAHGSEFADYYQVIEP